MKVLSLSAKFYVIIFIDDCTRMLWVYYIHAKSETFDVFSKFKVMLKNKMGI